MFSTPPAPRERGSEFATPTHIGAKPSSTKRPQKSTLSFATVKRIRFAQHRFPAAESQN
jgi:hypothetical protein